MKSIFGKIFLCPVLLKNTGRYSVRYDTYGIFYIPVNFACVADRIGIWKSWFLRRGDNWSTWRKTSWRKGENQQQTQPKYDIDAKIPTRATLVGMRALTTAQPFLPEYSHEYGCYTILSLVTTYMHCYSKSYDFHAWFPYLVVFRTERA